MSLLICDSGQAMWIVLVTANMLSVLLIAACIYDGRHDCDNRFTTNLTSAPLVPLLRRFTDIQMSKTRSGDNKLDEVSASLHEITEHAKLYHGHTNPYSPNTRMGIAKFNASSYFPDF